MYKGAWLASVQGTEPYSSVLKQGYGTSPVEAQVGSYGYGRRSTPDHVSDGTIGANLATEDFAPSDYGYSFEDTDPLYGYGTSTGLADRHNLGESNSDYSGTIPDGYPPYGPYNGGIPGGTAIRAVDHGAEVTLHAKSTWAEPNRPSWENKKHGEVEDATTSDPSQYEIQTSMRQRDQTRAGSQASGRENEQTAPIKSRMVGQKLKFWGNDSPRHYDMQPRSQDAIIRPFWHRTAGTGDPKMMEPNALYVSEPMQRVAPDTPDQGISAGNVPQFGYVEEDSTW